jgi:hypothetical protein
MTRWQWRPQRSPLRLIADPTTASAQPGRDHRSQAVTSGRPDRTARHPPAQIAMVHHPRPTHPPASLEAIGSCWPLLLGITLLLMGAGLQSALLGVRATMEGFGTVVTDAIMSGYYLGFLADR